jgi:hypothetical protein
MLGVWALILLKEKLWRADSKCMAYTIMVRKGERHGQMKLCAKLQQEEARIKERIVYLAKKRGVDADELWFNWESCSVGAVILLVCCWRLLTILKQYVMY